MGQVSVFGGKANQGFPAVVESGCEHAGIVQEALSSSEVLRVQSMLVKSPFSKWPLESYS